MECGQWQAQLREKPSGEDQFEYSQTYYPENVGEYYLSDFEKMDKNYVGPFISEMKREFPLDDDYE